VVSAIHRGHVQTAAFWFGGLAAAALTLGFSHSPPARAQAQPPGRSVSTSRQFVIYAPDARGRVAVGQFADETRSALLQVLGLPDKWELPIVLNLVRPSPGLPDSVPASRLALAQTGTGLKIQLDLRLNSDGDNDESEGGSSGESDPVRPRDEIVRALLLEIAYRERPELPAGRAFQQPPAWLVEGCAAAVENQRSDEGRLLPAGVDPALLVSMTVTPAAGSSEPALAIEPFLSKDPHGLDSASRVLYRACAFGLVRMLTQELPEGRAGLLAFLRALPAAQGEGQTNFAALRWHFPQLGDTPADLQRWWALTLAHLSVADSAVRILDVEETERRLGALLNVTVRPEEKTAAKKGEPATAGKVYALMDFEKFLSAGSGRAKENTARLAATRTGMLLLGARAHPYYRPIIAEYAAVVTALSHGQFQHVADRLRTLAAARAEVRTRREAVADYLNWFEATQLNTPSGAFEPYFQASRRAETLAPRERRTDTISTYLDGMELEFGGAAAAR